MLSVLQHNDCFILPTMERSLWDHMFNVFFKDPNLSKTFSFSDTSRSYVSKMHSTRVNWLVAHLEIKYGILSVAHRAKP